MGGRLQWALVMPLYIGIGIVRVIVYILHVLISTVKSLIGLAGENAGFVLTMLFFTSLRCVHNL